jgi:predicted hydrocarbon binding protein
MRHIKISQKELINVRKLYESVMSNACHGLFFREGSVYGEEIVNAALEDRENYFETAKKELKERGWLEDVTFDGDVVTISGSIEVAESDSPTCHRLRGILRYIYETHRNERVYCVEKSCQSKGDEACIFNIEHIE